MKRILLFVLSCALGGLSCDDSSPLEAIKGPPPLQLRIDYGSEKKTWLNEMVERFEASHATTASGRVIDIEASAMGSGEAMQAILDGSRQPHVFSPASEAYITLLNHSWLSEPGNTRPLTGRGESLVLSPIVIAIWKPMAEALGWPEKSVSWSELIAINTSPEGWGTLNHPEWGRFKLGHTHPGLSNSGLLAVLAEAYAGSGKRRGLTVADLDLPETRAFIENVEQSLVHYGKSTSFFAERMLDRGPGYISAAVLYENLVIESYGSNSHMPLVAIYPTEGTFWSDHPYAVLDAEQVGPEEREAAERFLAFLKEPAQQQRALELGFRPSDPGIAITAPVDVAHGVDPRQPLTLLEVPDGETLEHLLAVWEQTKKVSDVVLVFYQSGSLTGPPGEEARRGARLFLEGLEDRDSVSLYLFHQTVFPMEPVVLDSAGRAALSERLSGVFARGGTALYDAIALSYESAQARSQTSPDQIHAVVVMTDGNDENSQLNLAALKARLEPSESESPVKIFTIAYGEGADMRVLSEIAEAGQGMSAQGDLKTIKQTFQDMASFF